MWRSELRGNARAEFWAKGQAKTTKTPTKKTLLDKIRIFFIALFYIINLGEDGICWTEWDRKCIRVSRTSDNLNLINIVNAETVLMALVGPLIHTNDTLLNLHHNILSHKKTTTYSTDLVL